MKKMRLLFFIVLLPVAFSFNQPKKNQFSSIEAAPAIDLIDVQPSDNRGSLYYMTCAPKTKNDKTTAQLSASFTIRNKETKSLVLEKITYEYSMNGNNVYRLMSMDIDDLSVKTKTINAGASFSWQISRDYHQVDNAVEFYGTIPSSIQIKLKFEGYSTPYIITRSIKSYTNKVAGGAYGFPGRPNQLKEGEYWYAYGVNGGGSQFYAYDIKVEG